MKILIVEDEANLRAGLKDLVSGAGHDVLTADDGPEGARLGQDGVDRPGTVCGCVEACQARPGPSPPPTPGMNPRACISGSGLLEW